MERAEPLNTDTQFDDRVDPRRRARQRSLAWPLVAIIALVVVIAAIVFAWRRMNAPEPTAPAAPAPQASAPAPTAPVDATPKHPIEAAAATPPAAPESLPDVPSSDPALQDALASLFGGVPLDRVFHLQEIVPRFVATIDNLPRQTVALSKMPVQPVEGGLETAQANGQTLLRADNAERYATYIRLMEQVDTKKLVQTYVHFYPLFQKAYQDLGYPNGYFNDRLVEVIDNLLAAPEVPAPVELAQPKVLYEFADPKLEQLSAGQKMMIRMGPVNESRAKAKLRDIRRAVTGQSLPR
jgi:Protein of unknown function (DUF3014)